MQNVDISENHVSALGGGLEAAKWADVFEEVQKDVVRECERIEAILPRNEDVHQWRAYYQERLARLGNDALSLPARLLWVQSIEKRTLIKQYFAALQHLISTGEGEVGIHQIESEMKTLIEAEISRIKSQYQSLLT